MRRSGGARAGGFPGAEVVLAQLAGGDTAPKRRRVGLKALERIPVREHTLVQDTLGKPVGEVTSGLLAPTINEPIAMAYLNNDCTVPGTRLQALVRGKPVPMEVVGMPFVPHRYHRG